MRGEEEGCGGRGGRAGLAGAERAGAGGAGALPGKRDPDAPAKEAAIAAALGAARRGACRLLFLDECDLQLLPVLRACWQQGPRLRVPTPGTNAKRAFFGALDAASGAFHSADFDRKLAAHFVAFPQRLAAAYPAGPLVLAMDNVRMHDAKLVRRWLAANPRVSVLWLPKYAAHDALVPHPVPPSFLQPPDPVPDFRQHASLRRSTYFYSCSWHTSRGIHLHERVGG